MKTMGKAVGVLGILLSASGAAMAQAVATSICTPLVWGFCLEERINISVMVTVVLFGFGYLVARYFINKDQRRIQKNFYESLLLEISILVSALKDHIMNDTEKEFEEAVRLNPPKKIIFNARYSRRIFEAGNDKILSLPLILLKEIIEFYDKVSLVELVSESIKDSTFYEISSNGRAFLIKTAFNCARDASAQGDKVLQLLSGHLNPARDR